MEILILVYHPMKYLQQFVCGCDILGIEIDQDKHKLVNKLTLEAHQLINLFLLEIVYFL